MKRYGKSQKRIMNALYEAGAIPGAKTALYGLQLAQRTNTSAASLYPTLRELRNNGLVTDEWHQPDGKKKRRYYQLSPNGFALAQADAAGEVKGTSWRQFLPASLRWRFA